MRRRRGLLLDDDFGPAIAALKEASGLTWAQLARLLGTSTVNLWRWRNGIRPNADHLLDLQALARRLGLEHVLPAARFHEHHGVAALGGDVDAPGREGERDA